MNFELHIHRLCMAYVIHVRLHVYSVEYIECKNTITSVSQNEKIQLYSNKFLTRSSDGKNQLLLKNPKTAFRGRAFCNTAPVI